MFETVELNLSDTSIPVVVGRPREEPKGGVIVLASIFGSDQGTLQLVEELTERQLLVTLPSLFFRGDPGPCETSGEGRERALARMRSYSLEQGLQDLAEVARWTRVELQKTGHSQLTAHGICFGGHLAAHLACQGLVDALSSVHGGRLNSVSAQHKLEVPAALHFGDQDSAIPLAEVEEIRARWPSAEYVIYPGAGHGFAHPGAPHFRAEAYADSFERLVSLSLT